MNDDKEPSLWAQVVMVLLAAAFFYGGLLTLWAIDPSLFGQPVVIEQTEDQKGYTDTDVGCTDDCLTSAKEDR